LEGFSARGENARIAIYGRVSTHDQQTLPMQLTAMRAYVKRLRCRQQDIEAGLLHQAVEQGGGKWNARSGTGRLGFAQHECVSLVRYDRPAPERPAGPQDRGYTRKLTCGMRRRIAGEGAEVVGSAPRLA
jgi:hypothetical protein